MADGNSTFSGVFLFEIKYLFAKIVSERCLGDFLILEASESVKV